MNAYREGHAAGRELEDAVKSHRRVLKDISNKLTSIVCITLVFNSAHQTAFMVFLSTSTFCKFCPQKLSPMFFWM